VKVFVSPENGGMKPPYFTLNSVSCGDRDKIFGLNQDNVFPCSYGSENPVILSQSLERGNELTDDFWSIAKFQGELYVASTIALTDWSTTKP